MTTSRLLRAIDDDATDEITRLAAAISLDEACATPEDDPAAWSEFELTQCDTPLARAARNGQASAARVLLAAGATVDRAMEKSCATSLFLAAMNGHDVVVSLLLEAGATADLAANDGATPLFVAANRGHAEVVSLLLEAGATVDLGLDDGATPLFAAANSGHAEVVSLLLAAGATVDQGLDDGATPLYTATYLGHAEVVSLLLAAGAAVDAGIGGEVYKLPVTALHAACGRGHANVVPLLLAAGAAINDEVGDGVTVLCTACEQGHADIVSLLLAAGAAVDQACSDDGTSPLCISCEHGHAEVVSVLLAAGATVEQTMSEDITPLWMASQCGHGAVVSLLLQADAEVDRPSDDGYTPLCIASGYGHTDAAAALLKAGAAVNLAGGGPAGAFPLCFASEQGHAEAVSQLLAAGAAVNQAMAESGTTALCTASEQGHAEVVSLLLAAGAAVDLAMVDGATPLYVAIEQGQLACVQYLSSYGARRTFDLAGHAHPVSALDRAHAHILADIESALLEGDEPTPEAENMWCRIARFLERTQHWTPLHHLEVIGAPRARSLLRGGEHFWRIPDGQRVRIWRLAGSQEHLNGAIGSVIGYDAATGRHNVRVEELSNGRDANGQQTLSLLLENMPWEKGSALSVARTLAWSGAAPADSAAALVLRASKPWSPETHALWPDAARPRAVELCRLGYQLAYQRRPAQAQSMVDAWMSGVMRHALSRDGTACCFTIPQPAIAVRASSSPPGVRVCDLSAELEVVMAAVRADEAAAAASAHPPS